MIAHPTRLRGQVVSVTFSPALFAREGACRCIIAAGRMCHRYTALIHPKLPVTITLAVDKSAYSDPATSQQVLISVQALSFTNLRESQPGRFQKHGFRCLSVQDHNMV